MRELCLQMLELKAELWESVQTLRSTIRAIRGDLDAVAERSESAEITCAGGKKTIH